MLRLRRTKLHPPARNFQLSWAVSREKNYSDDDIPKALDFVEKEINEFDEVMEGHGDFCALVAARGTTNIFAKTGCKHLRDVNKPTFAISSVDLANIPAVARSIGNKFLLLKSGLRAVEKMLETKLELCLARYDSFLYFHVFISDFFLVTFLNTFAFVVFRVILVEVDEPKFTLKI
jgi:hypothetical protein